jgi:hypothetical protein
MYAFDFSADVVATALRLRPFRAFRTHGLFALIVIAVGLGLCLIVGFWAGKVAERKGREFGVFFTLGFLLTICGIIPGLIVVIIAYAIRPSPATGPAGAGTVPPPGAPAAGYQAPAPPPGAGPATPSPQGGYEYAPPPSVPTEDVIPPLPAAPPPPTGPGSGGSVPPPPPPPPSGQ